LTRIFVPSGSGGTRSERSVGSFGSAGPIGAGAVSVFQTS
jgi:hypothetical protein